MARGVLKKDLISELYKKTSLSPFEIAVETNASLSYVYRVIKKCKTN